MKFIIEKNLNESSERLTHTARRAGHSVSRWEEGDRVPLSGSVFYGSLNACRFMPGVIGHPDNLNVSAWMNSVKDIALNDVIRFETISTLKNLPESWDRVFIRPDSPMKEFSGRVLNRGDLTPENLDFGFYFNDNQLYVAASPAKTVVMEWRFVSVGRKLVTCSGYDPSVHKGFECSPPQEVLQVAETAAQRCKEPTVVIDVCLTDSGEARFVEYNLFSGSDLYNCDCDAIVKALV